MDLLRTVTPQLIVCDLHMPRGNGTELIAMLKQDERLRRIPAVAVTSSVRYPADDAMLRDMGAACVIPRELDGAEMLRQILAHLPTAER